MVFGKRRIPKHLIIQDNYQNYKSSTGYGWIIAAIVLMTISIFISIKSHAFAESRGYTHDAIEENTKTQKTGQLFFTNKDGGKTPSLHLTSDVDVEIHGLIANVNFRQQFRNDTSTFQEGTYVFPLSETAAINGMSVEIGERLIVGEIKEREEAKKIYKKAVNAGKRAALTEQQRSNLFTQKVANIAPGETVIVTLNYIERVNFSHQEFSWRLPTTLTPRYIPGISGEIPPNQSTESKPALMLSDPAPLNSYSEFGWAQGTFQVPDAHLITPPMLASTNDHSLNTISISIELNTGLSLSSINSPYHDISVKKRQKKHTITLANKREKMDRDFVLTWSATEENSPMIAAYSEKIGEKHYSMIMLVPPGQNTPGQGTNQTIESDRIFIIDTSGSMQGQSIVQAKQSLKVAIQNLDNNTRFNIIEFNSNYSKLFKRVHAADDKTKEKALRWIERLKANGGTEMYSALNAAMEDLNNVSQTESGRQERLKQILFITDGSVGNENVLFELIHNNLNNTRLFTVGIGSAPNSFFMRKSAQFGRGSFTHIGNTAEVSEKMQKILKKINSVATKNIRIELPPHFTGKNIDLYPKKIGDLYYGEPLLISGESAQAIKHITISGQSAGEAWSKLVVLPKATTHPTAKGISTIWAREKIESLEDEKIMRKRDLTKIKQEIIEIGLKHKLVSKHTSFVAAEKNISRNPEERLERTAVPNLTPSGSIKHVSYPSTATTAEITWWLGLFSAMLLIVFRRMNDSED